MITRVRKVLFAILLLGFATSQFNACSSRRLQTSPDVSERATYCDSATRYKRQGYAETRDALAWVGMYAPNMKFGLTLDEVWFGLECGYDSVRERIRDSERIAQLEDSRRHMRKAIVLFKAGERKAGSLTMQQAEELFTTLRRIGGRKPSRQELGDTEHGANEIDE